MISNAVLLNLLFIKEALKKMIMQQELFSALMILLYGYNMGITEIIFLNFINISQSYFTVFFLTYSLGEHKILFF